VNAIEQRKTNRTMEIGDSESLRLKDQNLANEELR